MADTETAAVVAEPAPPAERDPTAERDPAVERVPPGGRIFTLEGRTAPGLYLVAWLLSVGGLALVLLIGPLASSATTRFLLVCAGLIGAMLGFAAACGYQVLERRARPAQAYRGPAPLLAFGMYLLVFALAGVILSQTDAADQLVAPDPLGFLAIGAIQSLGYALVVWLVVIRTDALSWREMGWPTWPGAGSVLAAVATAVAVMLPTTFVLLILGGVIGRLLGVQAPDVLPDVDDSGAALAVAIAAAVIIPIGEEVFFRGFALTAWLRDLGPRSALLRSSLFFALVHIANISGDTVAEGAAQTILVLAVILPVGFVLGWLFLRRGLVAAIVGHVTYNGILLVLAQLAGSLASPRPAP